MKEGEERRWLWLLAGMFIFLAACVVMSPGFWGGGDSIAHYRIARYAFRHPYLFLDHWGKPFFTLLAAPFAQLGFNGLRLYNVMAGLLAAWYTFRAAHTLGYRHRWLALFFVVTAPVYFILFFSALTEVTFSLVLIVAVWWALRERYDAAAVVLSFLPFVRTEGIVIVMVMAAGMIWFGRYRSLPWLLTGFALFSLAGWPQYHDPLWVIHEMPYRGAADIYGHGSLLHFVKHAPRMFGPLLLVFWLLGLVSLGVEWRRGDERRRVWQELWFVVLPFLAYFSAHSYVWWRGLGGSLGLLRVMAGVVPLMAVTAVGGVDRVMGWIPQNRILRRTVPLLVAVGLLYTPLARYTLPLKEDATQRLLSASAEWLKHSPYYGRPLYYYDLYFQFRLGGDPYDPALCHEKVPDPQHPSKDLPPGSVIQWDAHYGPNEGHLPLQRLRDDPHLKAVKVFRPDPPFKVLGGHDYAIWIFVKETGDTLYEAQ